MEAIEAPAAKPKLKVIPWTERTGLNLQRAVRMVKMIAPVCDICRVNGLGWWENCPHDPYHSIQEETVRSPIVEEQNGERVVTGYQEKIVQHQTPNVRQVGLHTRIRSGRGVDAQKVRGWKFPQELGYVPMCEFNNCYASNPKIKTQHGAFCSKDHAAMVIAKAQGKILEAYDRDKLRKQIEEVVIR